MDRYYGWRRYVPVAARRRKAAGEILRMRRTGREISPVEVTGRKIAVTFWGNAWCRNLEEYSDYANRLPRGRTYVRNGSVIDLDIKAGHVHAVVSGSDIYEVDIRIKPLAKRQWKDIKGRCAGQIDSLVELLRGSISKSVMQIVTSKGNGLFPSPSEIELDCTCPDWAAMCKHVAGALYGVGARLDHAPGMLFTLRGVDPTEMVEAAVDPPPRTGRPGRGRVLASDDLSSVFGVDIEAEPSSQGAAKEGRPPGRNGKTGHTRKPRTNRTTQAKPGKRNSSNKDAQRKAPVRKKTSRKKAASDKKTSTRPASKRAGTRVRSKNTARKRTANTKARPRRSPDGPKAPRS